MSENIDDVDDVHFPSIDSDSFRRDSELGQTLMTCGKAAHPGPLSENQAHQIRLLFCQVTVKV